MRSGRSTCTELEAGRRKNNHGINGIHGNESGERHPEARRAQRGGEAGGTLKREKVDGVE